MAIVYPDFEAISKLRVLPTEGEFFLLDYLAKNLDSSYEIFFNPYLDGDRPDIVILKQHHCAIIIEIKDWILSSYFIDIDNKWFAYTKNGDLQKIRSPHQQVFRYKANMFDLHLPELGMAEALNKNFYKVIHPFVYFHCAQANDIDTFYRKTLDGLSTQKNVLNEQIKLNQINFEIYDNKIKQLSSKEYKIDRDRAMSFSKDSLDKLITKISKIEKDILFHDNIYEEFKRRLSPPDWVYAQGRPIEFDSKQQRYTQSIKGLSKIKGVAGCGKTSIIAARAINAYTHHESVLILTFNITLKRLIRDKISHINHHSKAKIDFNKIEISNYHQFFMAQINNLSKHINVPATANKRELEIFWDKEFKNTSYFEGQNTNKYSSIFIDEIQDYEKEWITIIRDYFLEPDGEMVLFGDQSQNIYQRDEDPLNKSFIKGFGRWEKLTRSYRPNIDSLLVTSFKQFQEHFLTTRHEDLDIFEAKLKQGYINVNLLAYHPYEDNKIDEISRTIDYYIKKYKLIPNDITILSSKVGILSQINDYFERHEKTITMFVTSKEKKACEKNILHDFEKIERRKKEFFVQNSGVIKISTIHSFKGMESDAIFCILEGDEEPEVVYTAITRAKKNLVVFGKENNIYAIFFKKQYNTN
ncbi:MAG: AAA family ATPase [Deltaproteobacteria bacterium]|jgi:hypothetical protein|nr:AAA family ATPase [Deltaproteobacteria bacterium]